MERERGRQKRGKSQLFEQYPRRELSCAGADMTRFITAMRFHNRKRSGRQQDLLVLLLDPTTYSFLTPYSCPSCARGC